MNRFWNKVNKTETCWEWIAFKTKEGYGYFRHEGITKRAHRFSWILTHGEIPKELHVLHKCDNPPCVNPEHLFLGTDLDNSKDRGNKGRTSKVSRNKGSDHPNSKFTEKDIIEIRNKYKSKMYTQSDLAKEYNTVQGVISNIILNKRWNAQ